MYDIFLIIPFATFVYDLFIFGYVRGQRRKTSLNRSFLLFIFMMAAVALIDFHVELLISKESTIFSYNIIVPFILSLGFVFLNFIYKLLEKNRDFQYWVSLSIFMLSVFITFIYPPIKFHSVPGYNAPVPIPSISLIVSFFMALTIIPSYAFYLCIRHMQISKNIQLIHQLRLIVMGALISTPVSLFTVCIGPVLFQNYTILRFGSLGILISSVFMYHAIKNHFFLSVNIEQIENSFYRIFENVHDSVILLDSEGDAVQINRSAEQLFGCPASKLTGDKLEKCISGYKFTNECTDAPASLMGSSNKQHQLLISQSLIKANDISYGKLLIIRDITIQKNAEQQMVRAQNLEAIGQLAGGIAHDFNNYLCGIISNLALVKMELDVDSKAAQILSLGEATALSARALTRQLLTFSKEHTPINEVFDVNRLIIDTGNFVRSGSDISLRYDLNKIPINIKGDKGQLRQVFQNVIMNAVQSMPGGGEIEITGRVEEISLSNLPDINPGLYYKIDIKDHGEGIPPEILPRIFEPYFTTKSNGNGLGLSIVYSILKKHGGYINVASQIGEGSIFTIHLPVTGEVLPAAHPAPSQNIHASGRILIMDDYMPVRYSLSRLLERIGYVVDQASSGKEALDLYDKTINSGENYYAVITDLTVPGGMGGIELAENLHKRDPSLRIIVSSGFSGEVELSKFKELGFSGILHKPYNFNELQDILHSSLSVS
jgi:two-component system cell cycle sensor histidine kinase/response regulator CckA